jgi:hypothetical protein
MLARRSLGVFGEGTEGEFFEGDIDGLFEEAIIILPGDWTTLAHRLTDRRSSSPQ